MYHHMRSAVIVQAWRLGSTSKLCCDDGSLESSFNLKQSSVVVMNLRRTAISLLWPHKVEEDDRTMKQPSISLSKVLYQPRHIVFSQRLHPFHFLHEVS